MADEWAAFREQPQSSGPATGPDYGSAISSIESGGNYRAVGPATKTGDRALGKYQIMTANVGPWSKEVLGREVSPTEFMGSKEIQDAIFNGKFGQYAEKYGPEGAAKAWFAGEKGMNNPNARDSLGTTVASYGAKFNKALGQPTEVSARAKEDPWAAFRQSGEAPAESPAERPAPQIIPAQDGAPTRVVMDMSQDDHGLAERQKLSPLEKAASPITGYWDTYQKMNKEAQDQVSRGAGQIMNPGDLTTREGTGLSDILTGAGNMAAGAVGYVASPVNAAYRSVVGQPVEDVTGIPREYTEFAAQLATPGIGLPRAVPAPAPNIPRPSVAAAPQTNEIVAAADRVSQVAPETVNVPRAFASDSMPVQRTAQAVRNLPVVGDAIPRATGEMADQLSGARNAIASSYGEGSGPNVASRIGRTLDAAAGQEGTAAREATAQGDAAVLAAWERAHNTAREGIAGQENSALQAARASVGDMSPQDMGATLIARLRQGEREAHATKERLYGVAGQSDGVIDANAVRGIRGDITRTLDESGLIVDPQLTPAASRMVTELDNISSLNIPNRVARGTDPNAAAVGVNMQGLEQTRKRLGSMAQAATNDADRRAARHVMRAYDDWLDNAFDNSLFSGSDEALNAYRQARAANADWRTRYGFNRRDDADRLVNRVVTGEVTPQELSNWLVGSTQVGSKGVSSRLLTRVAEATNGDAEAAQAIRGGVWNRLTQTAEGVADKAPARVANDISEFLNGSGRDVANRLLTPQQRQIAQTYADTLRRGADARATLTEAAANSKPSSAKVNIGPMQELAETVLGKGGKTDEALFTAIDAYAKAGGKGDVKTLADLVKTIPEKDKGDLAGALIRKMGHSTQTNDFTLEMFASDWGKYSPQAKAVLFGNAGPYRQALDDIALISQRYKDIGRRFGNPSGTAQNVSLLGTAAWVIGSPYTAIPAILGGAVAARMLAAPAGASSISKWGRVMEAVKQSPSPQRIAALQTASRNLVNTSTAFGGRVSPPDFMRQLQGSVPAGAQDEQP